MTLRIEVDQVAVRMLQQDFGSGGQGKVHLVALESDPSRKLILKELALKGDTEQRIRWLCEQNLSALSPAIAAPIVCEATGDGRILHLSPYIEGVSQDQANPVALPLALETALEFACLMTALDENGISHGDLAESNLLLAPDGAINVIDLDGFVAHDPAVPSPDTAGHRHMFAPEQRDGSCRTPTKESGYFQIALEISMMLTGRYPTDGLPSEPAAIDKLMSQGHWPEHDRSPEPGDLPKEVLGQDLIALFDQGFSLDPRARPEPDVWRCALMKALHNCWVHDCGQALVADPDMKSCPGCGAGISIPGKSRTLKIQVLPNGPRFGVELKDRHPVVLGRETMPSLPSTVSGRHLEILPFQDKVLLRHVGSNPTLIEQNGHWFSLREVWKNNADLQSPIRLTLAETALKIAISS